MRDSLVIKTLSYSKESFFIIKIIYKIGVLVHNKEAGENPAQPPLLYCGRNLNKVTGRDSGKARE
jgi:hypothetical protein